MPGSAVGLSGVASSGSGETRLEGEWRWNRRDSLGGSGKTDTVATSETRHLWSGPTLHGRQESLKRPHDDATAEYEDERSSVTASSRFRTARDQLAIDEEKKFGRAGGGCYGTSKKCLGTRRGPGSRFVPPITNKDDG
ncbi:hypothetical protein LSAT2_004310 [Lamellibrachia satsuma]|nr:hypothetical protein LSAT2_004310 [Lamellibrachia satsuma]